MSANWLALSPYILPQLRMGNAVVGAQNLCDGTGRRVYLDGAVDFLNRAAQTVSSLAKLQELLSALPFGSSLIKESLVDGRVKFRAIDDAVDLVHFDLARVRVLLSDGRKRRATEMLAYETGEMTPGFGKVLAALVRGIERGALLRLAEELGVEMDGELLTDWLQAGVIEDVEPTLDRVPASLKQGEGDRVSWLGHAMVMFQAPDAALWVDPYQQPRIAWRDTELEQVFSQGYADRHLFADYGPHAAQLSVHGLPIPDAVLITHQDSDHFGLGSLMALPPETTIVVPRADPGRPWEVDLRSVVHQLLGADRKVVALGHGETIEFGSLKVTAFPFVGEYPAVLPHSWNCYLVETPRSAAVFVADAALTEAQSQWLQQRLNAKARPAILFARSIQEFDQPGTAHQKGYQDSHEELYSSIRLWPWHTPMQALFDPSPVLGVSAYNLRELARHAGVKHFFPYALGSAPWFRFTNRDNFFVATIASMPADGFSQQAALAASLGAPFAPLQYATPFRLG